MLFGFARKAQVDSSSVKPKRLDSSDLNRWFIFNPLQLSFAAMEGRRGFLVGISSMNPQFCCQI